MRPRPLAGAEGRAAAAVSPLIADAIGKARRQGGSAETQLINACDQVAVDIGSEVLRHVPGRISTEVDARFAGDRGMCVAKARKLIQLYEKNGIGPERILIKLAATWEGIRAAEELEQSGINCNLTLLFSFAQARAWRRSGRLSHLALCGPHLRLVSKHQPQSAYQVDGNPAVVSVRQIYQYYKSHGYDTVVMGASFHRMSRSRRWPAAIA